MKNIFKKLKELFPQENIVKEHLMGETNAKIDSLLEEAMKGGQYPLLGANDENNPFEFDIFKSDKNNYYVITKKVGNMFKAINLNTDEKVCIKRADNGEGFYENNCINEYNNLGRMQLLKDAAIYNEIPKYNYKVYYFVMPLFGQNLEKFWENHKTLSYDQRLKLIYSALKALNKAHDLNIAHNDVHLENFVLNRNRAVLIDFGTSSDISKTTKEDLQNDLARFVLNILTPLLINHFLDEGKSLAETFKPVSGFEKKIYDFLDKITTDANFYENTISYARIKDGIEQLLKLKQLQEKPKLSNNTSAVFSKHLKRKREDDLILEPSSKRVKLI